jgi:hypothetical protein
MAFRKLAVIGSAIAVLGAAAPVGAASAQTTPVADPGVTAPCYPEPVWCGPSGQPWFPFFTVGGNTYAQPAVGDVPAVERGFVQLPGPVFGPRPVETPA